MILPTMPAFVDSAPGAPSYLKCADLNHLAYGLNLCIYRPLAVAVQTTTQSIADGGWSNVAYDQVQWDSVGGFGSNGGATYTCQLAGRYQVIGTVPAYATGSSGVGDLSVRFTVNGIAAAGVTATLGMGGNPGSSGGTAVHGTVPAISRVLTLGLGDQVCVQIQGKADTFTTAVNGASPSSLYGGVWAAATFSLFWVGV